MAGSYLNSAPVSRNKDQQGVHVKKDRQQRVDPKAGGF